MSARELPGLPGLGRAAGGWTSDARFWRERGPPCWRRAPGHATPHFAAPPVREAELAFLRGAVGEPAADAAA